MTATVEQPQGPESPAAEGIAVIGLACRVPGAGDVARILGDRAVSDGSVHDGAQEPV